MQTDDNGTTYHLVSSESPAAVGAVTAEKIEALIQSAEAEGVSASELQDLKTLLEDLRSGAVTLPEPQSTYFERTLPNGDVEVFYATAPIDHPEAVMDEMELVQVVESAHADYI